MYQAALQLGIRKSLPYCFEQCPVPVTGYACDINTQFLQVEKVFVYFIITFPVGEPVQLCIAYVVVVEKHKAEVVGEIRGVNKQVCPVLAFYLYRWGLYQVQPEQPLEAALRHAAVTHEVFVDLPFAYPFLEPYKLVGTGNARVVTGKEKIAVLAFKPLLTLLRTPFDNGKTFTGPTRLF